MSAVAPSASAWERRFTAPTLGFPSWADIAPSRLAFLSNESGIWQVWVCDLSDERRRRVSDESLGVESVLVAPDGRIVWWSDATGDERGAWVALDPDTDVVSPLLEGLPAGWSTGISFAVDTVAVGIGTREDYRVYVSDGDGPPRLLHSASYPSGVGRNDVAGTGGLSADGSLVCIRHAEHGDVIHQELRVLDAADGSVVGELVDAGSQVDPVAWHPRPDDRRLLFTSEIGPFERPGLWDVATGERRDLEVDLEGAVIPLGWWPDGTSILARQEFEGQDRLVRVNPSNGTAEVVADTGGEIPEAAVRPDGQVWLLTSDSVHPPRVVTADGTDVLRAPGEPAPAGRGYRSFWARNQHGTPIQSFVVTPAGEGPFPTVVSVHGGPEWHERNRFEPETQAFVDAGFAVALVNYRGSTGYGVEFRRALVGDPWLPESEDVVATLDALIAEGIADPQRVAFSGWSWGGCLACLDAGLYPDRWRAVFAGIPSGDFRAAHEAAMPEIQAYDLALYGGGPDELPERWRERDPMTFVDRAVAPALVIAGENDPRCPLESITPWVDALRSRGVEVELHIYAAGHHANATAQQVEHMAAILSFFERHVLRDASDVPG
ncbi:MAG: prolyl oligopeptidase family serine peptidase [Actinomycetota bacterium]